MRPESVAALDTNMLLLRLAWSTDQSLLRSFKRVSAYSEDDAELLKSSLARYTTLVSTPHILGETSNFIDQSPMYCRQELMEALRRFVLASEEWYEQAKSLIAHEHFHELGLADTGLLSLSKRATVFTVDWRLAGRIGAMGGRVVNFNHLRGQKIL